MIAQPDWTSCTEEEFWKYIAWHLENAGIKSVLVGGAVVAIYSEGLYRSGDVDIVPDDLGRRRIASVLQPLGFCATKGRYFHHPACKHLVVEFPPGPVSLGEDISIRPAEITVGGQILRLLSPTDCVKDRLAGWIHWRHRANFDQAVLVALRQEDQINWQEIAKWCQNEGAQSVVEDLRKAVATERERSS